MQITLTLLDLVLEKFKRCLETVVVFGLVVMDLLVLEEDVSVEEVELSLLKTAGATYADEYGKGFDVKMRITSILEVTQKMFLEIIENLRYQIEDILRIQTLIQITKTTITAINAEFRYRDRLYILN